MSSRSFPTFCHISEFRDQGYPRLDTMICLSSPLTLWAPSLHLVEKHQNEQVNAELLCRLVENGVVRIAAREAWINNGARRRKQAADGEFEGATWTTYDERIQRIAAEDQNVRPKRNARVQIADEETGYERAEKFLSEHPEAIERVSRLLKDKKVPAGTVERIEQRSLVGFQAAREVLRDASNHGCAITDTGSEVPFLSLEYGEFMKLINEIDEPLPVTASDRRLRSVREVAEQTLDLLDDLAVFGHQKLEKFAGSHTHKKLAEWMAARAEDAKDKNVTDIEALILSSLHRDVDANFPELLTPNLREIYRSGELTEVLSRSFELLATAVHPTDPWHLAGALLVVLRLGHGLLVRFNFAPPYYKGMNWPFLYAFGRKPRLMEINDFRSYLERRLRRIGRLKAS